MNSNKSKHRFRSKLSNKRVCLLSLEASDVFISESSIDAQHLGAVEKVIEKVINNAQVTIKNIHLRFEDAETVPGASVFNASEIARRILSN